MLRSSFFIPALVILLTACGGESLDDLPRVSLSPELQAIYERSCKNCHEVPATGSPQTGNAEQWALILEKPMDEVLARVVNGYGGMPPLGQCFECNMEQFETLVHYMSRPEI